jgi:hypothetical protein
MFKNARLSRRWQLVLVAIVAALVLARPSLAADFSGTWAISYRLDGETETVLLDIVQERSTVSGVGSFRVGTIGDPIAVEIRQGRANSRRFRFQLARINGPEGPAQTFFGEWYKNELSGRTDGTFGSRMIVGVRRQGRD